ncbi:hypothetical protein DYBT9275_04166 [Dyadobacter sp. CECT 9275]|uniref:Glycosyltransferase 2-like domain-containing protein n=1 Tax=Dyadobacter helix TaxID=2822344 RepID=A0A916JIT0_9BACT|nr:glycosyltransferase [Dyadobacter sp. CECT 9275]CAG5007968.1 hypothetical protein DYBT9275_04166 [Dyadobacter sp. CECT 9275]
MDVSVIIPTWNRASTITRAILSVLNQTKDVKEIIICDDGSTDNTLDIVRDIADPRIRWLSGIHSGLPAVPRNRGLFEAKGEWIAFLDSDDEWLPRKIESQLALISKTKNLAACSNAFRITANNQDFSNSYFDNDTVLLLDLKQLLKINKVICSSALFHSSLISKLEGFPENHNLRAIEDYALWLRLACLTPIAYHPAPLLRYYDDPSNSIRKEDSNAGLQKNQVLSDFHAWRSRKSETLGPLTKLNIWNTLNQLEKGRGSAQLHFFIKKALNLINHL